MTTMNQDVQWTTALGNAFLAQQPDVMAAVQRMRARAEANGKLSSNSAQTVTTETGDGQTAIDIAPADPRVIYVPQYNPVYIWGPPVWGYYPPLYYGAYGFGYYPGINLAICFGGWGGWGGWGWGPNWFGGSVFVNAGFFNHYGYRGGLYAGGFAGRPLWQHDPAHRLGISYPNSRLTARYGSASVASRGAMTSMTRSTAMGYSRSNGTGNWNRFGSAPASAYGNRPMIPAARGTAPQNAGRPAEGQWQHFQGAQPNRAPAQQYSAPAQRNPGPAQQYQSAPRTQAPNYGGAGRSFGGGAAGNSGRSHSSGGGASHGGARR
jgi:hypothetical protein